MPRSYNPGSMVNKGVSGCKSSAPCSKCQGDCDSDAECTGQLKCYQRNNKKKITGCTPGGAGDTNGYDYCYDPYSLVSRGAAGCSPSKKCTACIGEGCFPLRACPPHIDAVAIVVPPPPKSRAEEGDLCGR